MNKAEISLLVEQIRNIILSKPITPDLKSDCEELGELQDAIAYLSNCLLEAGAFLKHLQNGELEVDPPSRHNFLASNVKELHSALKHLTWQANQVANGDYNQKVDFLGDFSTSFNAMIQQLSQREQELKRQSVALEETVELTKSIMDGLKDWIVVTDNENDEIIYTNQSAKQLFYDMTTKQHICGGSCDLMKKLKEYQEVAEEGAVFDFTCPLSMKTLRAKSFGIQWNNKAAYAHYIQDITSDKEYREQVEEMAYTDVLTGLYNRRYCLEQLNTYLKEKTDFSFCMVDLDGLKFANDNFGHSAGDKYLQIVAREMQKVTRTTDTVCRIGGDEFAILFPNCTLQSAVEKMKLVSERIESLSDKFPMSISHGTIYVSKEMNILPETIMLQADERMYVLKNIKKISKLNKMK